MQIESINLVIKFRRGDWELQFGVLGGKFYYCHCSMNRLVTVKHRRLVRCGIPENAYAFQVTEFSLSHRERETESTKGMEKILDPPARNPFRARRKRYEPRAFCRPPILKLSICPPKMHIRDGNPRVCEDASLDSSG